MRRADDLAAIPLAALRERNPGIDWAVLDEVILGCANQAGEDNRNVARMAALLAGFPPEIPGITVNRLCASGLDAVGAAARAIRSGEADLIIAGGAESMSRAPYVMGKATAPYARNQQIEDTTMGWRFVNPAMRAAYGVDTMPQTAENVARNCGITREQQDRFALVSQERAALAQASGRFGEEVVPVDIPDRKAGLLRVEKDEHPRETSLDALGWLRPVVDANGTVTAGNASGINDGAAAMIVASEGAIAKHGLIPSREHCGHGIRRR